LPILPELKALFEAQHNAPAFPTDTPIPQLRSHLHSMIDESFGALSNYRQPAGVERDLSIPVVGGEVTLRLYSADGHAESRPCHVYYHGGGFFLGTLDQADNVCRGIVEDVGCAVVSVDYRLAPEHPFPTAVEDAFAALQWIATNADGLGIDPAKISVGGASAGGNLAAVVAQLARDRGGPSIIAQVLEIPVTDFRPRPPLMFPEENITISGSKVYGPLYLSNPEDALNPHASPLLADNLSQLPPALIMCAEYDQLRPESEEYAAKLSNAGVKMEFDCWVGQFHGSQNFDKLIPEIATAYRTRIAEYLKESYWATAQF
jgi:acetyl esterase